MFATYYILYVSCVFILFSNPMTSCERHPDQLKHHTQLNPFNLLFERGNMETSLCRMLKFKAQTQKNSCAEKALTASYII